MDSTVTDPVGTNVEAFEAFAREAEPKLRRALAGWCGPDKAGDAVSEALAWAWQHWDEVESMGNPVGYLYRVGQSRSRDRRAGALPAPAELGVPWVEPGLVPALAGLPDRQRTAVWLCVACSWTHAEAAEAMDITRSAVGTHVARALDSLRDALGSGDQ